jgi:hypothetical protein
MNATIALINKKIWPLNYDQLHRDSQEWLSQVDHWKGEVRFLEKTMRSFLPHPMSSGHAAEMRDCFNKLMASIKPEIRAIEGWIRSFHRHLARMANPQSHDREVKNHTEHRHIYRKMSSFQRRLSRLKQRLFELFAEIMREEKRAESQRWAIRPNQPVRLLRRSG